ncbi:MAG: hypothetical protein WAW62_02420 [Candidatus Saccharimonas aalborgensis]
MSRLCEKGSAHVIIIICLVFALLCALGIAFYQNFVISNEKNDNPSTQSSQSVNNSLNEANDQNKTDLLAVDTSKYLVLEDWGVKMLLPSFEKAFVYKKISMNGKDAYAFTTKAIDNLGGDCALASTNNGTLVVVWRESQSSDQIDSPRLNGGKPINGYYYYRSGSFAPCSEENNSTVNQVETSGLTATKELVDSLRAK